MILLTLPEAKVSVSQLNAEAVDPLKEAWVQIPKVPPALFISTRPVRVVESVPRCFTDRVDERSDLRSAVYPKRMGWDGQDDVDVSTSRVGVSDGTTWNRRD